MNKLFATIYQRICEYSYRIPLALEAHSRVIEEHTQTTRELISVAQTLQSELTIIARDLQAEMGVFKKNVKFSIEEIRKTEPTRWQADPVTVAEEHLLRKKN